MLGKLRRRSPLRAAVESIVRAIFPSPEGRSAGCAPVFRVEPLEERQLLSGTLTIAQENQLPGSPVSAWNVASGGDLNLCGFATNISVNQGDTESFSITDNSSVAYTISIFRLGYYQGLGARLVTTINSPTITVQPAPLTNATSGMIDCGNWSVSASWTVPTNATSGLYIADLMKNGVPDSQIPFVVRDDADHSQILYQTSDSTWEAYNSYGGNSLYESASGGLGANDDGNTPRAYEVSYNRPFVNRGENEGPQEGYIFGSEYPMIRFLEENGYDVSYATDVDTARYPSHLLDHQIILTSGHDEYWSQEQLDNMTAARNAGINMALFSGNEGFWRIQWAPSTDPSATPWRTIICYKATLSDEIVNPAGETTFTGAWRDPRFPAYWSQEPENAFNGTISEVNGVRNDSLSVSYPDSLDRFWRNTSVATMAPGDTTTFPAGTLGYEWDEDLDNGFRPAGLIDLSQQTMDVSPKLTLDYGGNYGDGTATHSMTLYRAASGALVFSAGQTQWSWGLDTNHDRSGGPVQPAMQQATINLLADMGVQPTTLIAGLVTATASTDFTPPTSTITAPTPNATFTNGVPVTITGTAVDAGGGIVAGVEVSTDNGVTWHPAVGTNNWSYTWIPGVQGNTRILSRATDDSGNIETPSIGRGVVVSSSGPFGIFTSGTTPQTGATTSTAATTLGVMFTSSVAGQIQGIRFYKGTSNAGTHIGSLWTSTGTLLASATFSNESASGWQQVNFSSPVTIQTNTVYVASYFAPNGHYYGDDFGLGRNIVSGPLTALAGGTLINGATTGTDDGLYAIAGTNTFPTTADADTNFFVDVVFQPNAGDTTPPTVRAVTPAAGPSSSAVDSVSITFSESIEVPSLQFSLTGPGNVTIPATVSYVDSTHTATLTPTSSLAPDTAYDAGVFAYDLALNSLAQPYLWSFTTPQNYSIWTTSTTPTNPANSTTTATEVGVRFTSDVAGSITGLLFYKGAGNTGTHVADLWSNSGTLLASATFSGESASGWEEVNFAAPIAITANTTYVASYFAPNGHYASDSNYFSTAFNDAPLHAPADGTAGNANGVFIATSQSGVFPTSSTNSTNYWVDVVLSSGGVDTTPPIIAGTTPLTSATGVSVTAPVTATFNEPINSSTLTFTLKGPGNVSVPATVTYNPGTQTATLTPTSFLSGTTTYTASVSASDISGNAMTPPYTWTFATLLVPAVISENPAAGATDVLETIPVQAIFNEGINSGSLVFTLTGPGNVSVPATVSYNSSTLTATLTPLATLASSTTYTVTVSATDLSGNPMPAPMTWSFTTEAAGTTFTVWPSSTVPGTTSKSDTSSVELGVRFTTDVSGYITGIRFYKGSGNTGTHIGNLWSDTGTLLATATFISESGSGWQQGLFNNPVAVVPGTTYVASYFDPMGHYAVDQNYFVNSYDSPPLHALADGTNGESNGLYIYSATSKFPNSSFKSSNYYVDVVFMTTPQPNQVTGVGATPGPNQNVLSWSAATRAVTYNIYRGTTPGGEAGTAIATGITTLTYTDPGLTPGTTYYYKVTAVDAAGESVRSSEVSATPIKATPIFSGITSATITYGTGTTTLSGTIAAGAQIPSGTVSILINGVTANATINATTGAFSTAFDTHAIPASATAYAVSYSFTANANFNAASDTSHTLTVNKRTLTVTATGVNRVYDGTTAATVTLSDNRVNGDALTITDIASFADKNVGTGKAVSVTGIAITGGAAAGDYTLASTTASTTANITARALTVSATGVNRVYNATNVGTVTLSDNRVAGDALTLAYGSAVFADKNVGNGKTVSVSGINITGADAGNYTWNATASTTANITPFALTVTATGQNKVYDAGVNAAVALGDNRFAGDSLTVTDATATFADKNVANGKTVSVSGINVTGTDAGNYTWNTTASTTANITPFALVVSATGQNKVYDGTPWASATLGDNRKAGDSLTVSFASASFANKTVGVGKTVTVSGINVTGTDAANYTFNTSTITTATISPFALTITATGQNKSYDRGLSDMVTLGDNRIAGDVLTLGYGSATFADKNVGANKAVSVSGITVTGPDSGNYTWNTTASTTASITPIALAVTATAQNKVYDSTTAATVTLGDNRLAGDVLTITYASATFADKNVGAGKTVSVSGINVTGTDAGNYTFNTSTSTTASITPLALVVTVTGQNKVYEGTSTATVTLGDNRLAGDSITVTDTSATFADKNVGASKPVSVSGINVTGTDAGNYTWNATASTTASITARSLTVGAAGQNKTYDGTPVATVTLTDNRVGGDSLTITYGAASFADKNAGVGKTVSVSGINVTGTDAGNYTFNATATTTATITPIALTVGAVGQNRVYNGTNAVTVTLTDNRVAGDVLTLTYGSATFADKSVGAGRTVSVTGINVTGTDSANYTFNTTASTTASITPLALTVTATGQNKPYDQTTAATVTLGDNRISGDSLTLSYASATFADKNAGTGKTVSVSGITVTGTDSGNYTWNTTASTTANITPIALTVSAIGQNKVYDGTNSATVTLGDNRLAGDVLNLSYASATVADKFVGSARPISVSGINVTGADSLNYTFNTTATTSANITPFALTVTTTGQNKVYDGTNAATVTLGDNRLSGDVLSVSYGSAAFADKKVANGKTVSVTGINVTGTDAGNYTFNTTAATTANITPFALAVGAVGQNKPYDGTSTATVTLTDNRISGDTLTLSYASAAFADKNAGTAKTVTVTGINVGGADASNYTFNTSTTTTGNITPIALTVTAIGQNKIYNATTAATVTLSDNRLPGDSLSLAYGSAAFSDKNVGNAKIVNVSGINVTGADAVNYTFNTTASTTASITPELVVNGTSGADTLRLLLDTDGVHVDWFLNGTSVIGQLAVGDAAGLTINAGAAGMTINLDRTNGNPLPALMNLNGVFTLNGLQGTDPLAGTTLNVNRSTVYVTYADAAHDPINGIRNDLAAGYNGGAWTGSSTISTGAIRSANAAADTSQTTAIGYVDSNSGLIAGQPANTIELKFTPYGDTGLTGSVGFTDFMRMTQHYTQNSGSIWSQGDFNYDGSVNSSDFTLLSKTYNMTLPAPAAPPDPAPAMVANPVSPSTSVTPAGRSPALSTPVDSVGAAPVSSPTPSVVSTPGLSVTSASPDESKSKAKTAAKKADPKKLSPKKTQLAVKKGKA